MASEHIPQTVLHARETRVVVGPDKPFVMIGERINPTNRAKLSETMESHDMSVVNRDAEAQVAAGAQVLDINVGTAFGVESEIMALAVKAVMSVVDVPLCIDSSDPAAIAAGLAAYREVCGTAGKPLINSTTGEQERLDIIAPLAAEYGAAVIGLTNDEDGIPETPERRFELAVAIMDRMAEEGVPREDLLIDGLTLTVGADHTAAPCTMEVTERVTRELSLNTTSGASNVSFGLPGRKDLNTTFLAMMMTKGLTSAITNPLKPEIIATVRAADLFLGLDAHALGWIQFFREQQAKSPRGLLRRVGPSGPQERLMGNAAEQFTVVFQPSGARGKIAAGTHLRAAARQLGVEIESVCAENATCGKCRVLIEEGNRGGIESSLDHVTPIGTTEDEYLTKRRRAWDKLDLDVRRLRLSCQAEVCGDVAVFVPESSRGNRQIVRKSATDRPIELRPTIRRYFVEMEPPTLENPLGDVERLADALVAVMERVHTEPGFIPPSPDELVFDYPVLRTVAHAVRADDWKVSVAVSNGLEVIDVRPGFHDEAYGAAIDVGSTSIALYLCDLESGKIVATESMMNPQTAYGDDIMSRMSYELDNDDGLATLNAAVVSALNQLLRKAVKSAGLALEDVLELVIVGNTTMHHILLNIPTGRLALAPYVPTVHRPLDIKARELRLDINRGANVHLLPIEASFVGADNMAVLIAEEPHKQDEELLIIDVGTNAELVLGNRTRLLCTSTPTGPAFEGAHVEYGIRAAPGAIERISINPSDLEPTCRVITGGTADDAPTKIKGICGSAIIDAIAEMFRVGILDSRGRFDPTAQSPRLREGELGKEYVIAWESETSIGRDIPITLQDVRQIQLAKAALYTAAQILLREAGLQKPDKIILAGAFGSHIDPTAALILGMIPDCPIDRVIAVGNAAGDGARIALLNKDKRTEAAEVARTIRRVELPVDPDFQNQYMMALNFPHMSDDFPSISHLIPDHGPDPLAERFKEEFDV